MSNLTPNMNLVESTIAVDSGYNWELNLNTSLSIIDSHNHSVGNGVQITPNGLNINLDLPIQANNLIQVRSTRYNAQLTTLSLAADLGCTYVSGVDLYYNDINGNQIQITKSGGVAGTPGSIANLVSPASAAYVAANSTFVWQSGVSTAAIMDNGPIIIRNTTASSFGLTLQAPTLSSNYNLTLPGIPSVSNTFLSIDTSGNIASVHTADGIASLMTSVGADDIAVTMDSTGANAIAASMTSTGANAIIANITTIPATEANIIANARTRTVSNVAGIGGIARSATSSGAFSSSSNSFVAVSSTTVTLTTSGRPVMILLQPDGTANNSFVGVVVTGGAGQTSVATVAITNLTSGVQYLSSFESNTESGSLQSSLSAPGSIAVIDNVVAGTYSYQIQVVNSGSGQTHAEYCILTAYEL